MSSPKRKGSQFAGAAALFQKKEKEMLEKGSLPAVSPRPNMNKLGNSSMGHIGYSPKQDPARSSLRAPPFVSPGAGATSRPSWKKNASQYPTSSYLDKDSGTPSQKSKTRAELDGFNGLAFSPSPDTKGKAKVNSTSWRDKQSISFQATSPGTLQRKTVRPAFNQHFGGSFLDKTPGSGTKQSRISNSSLGVFEETPDIKIEVKIPDIDRKIRARRASQSQAALEQKANNVPEWKLKFQEREANRIRKENEKQERSASLIQAIFWGWKARMEYPKLLEANADRLYEMKEKERMKAVRRSAAIKLQSSWRRYLPRKRFLYVQECKRRRLRNEKEIKHITKVIAKMPKETKADIKAMKKEYAEKKKDVKKELKRAMKEDDKKLENIKKSGKDMIEYLQNENKKLTEKQVAMKVEYKVLEKQLDVLTQKSDEIARNFTSLKGYVEKKNLSIRKNEINSQKCRHRYLPKYRTMIKDLDKHCIVERRIGILYKERLESIVQMLIERCSVGEVVFDAKEALVSCQKDIDCLPVVDVPDGLKEKISANGN